MKLSPEEFTVLIKTLGFLATVCSDIEIKDSEICNKTNDKVVTYNLKLPFNDKINLSFASIANAVKVLKPFTDQTVEISETDTHNILHMVEDDVYFSFTKPITLVNPFNKDKIEALVNQLSFETIPIDINTLNRIRTLVHKFNSDLIVDLESGELRISNSSKDTAFSKKIDNTNLSYKPKFRVLQHAFPTVQFVSNGTFSYAKFMQNGQEYVIYMIETFIEINNSQIPFRVIGAAELVTE